CCPTVTRRAWSGRLERRLLPGRLRFLAATPPRRTPRPCGDRFMKRSKRQAASSTRRRVPALTSLTSLARLAVCGTLLAACAPERATSPARAIAPAGSVADKADAPVVVSVEVIPFAPNDVLTTINGVSVFNGGFGSAIDKPEGGSNDFYSLTD